MEIVLLTALGVTFTINMKYYIFHVISISVSVALITVIRASTTVILSSMVNLSHLSI